MLPKVQTHWIGWISNSAFLLSFTYFKSLFIQGVHDAQSYLQTQTANLRADRRSVYDGDCV